MLHAKLQGDVEVTKPEGEQSLEVVSPDLLVKHPLQNVWSLWFFKNDKSRNWADNLKCVTNVSTVEDFWALYNHILPVSKLPSGCDYSMFKEGIEPMWEDEQNKRGGRWLINLSRNQRGDLDAFWQEMLLCLIGEAFDDASEDICGAVVNIRGKGDKLAMWTGNATRVESNKKIGLKLKERLNVPQKMMIGYQAHDDTIAKTGSMAKNRLTV